MKLSGAMETRARGPASELISSYLARHFGILRPDPAAVRLHPDLVKWLVVQRRDLAHIVSNSPGLNFGTRLLTDLPEAMVDSAAQIFAFDALIENDDRSRDNPNLLARGDDLFAIDHESAFAFLYFDNTFVPRIEHSKSLVPRTARILLSAPQAENRPQAVHDKINGAWRCCAGSHNSRSPN